MRKGFTLVELLIVVAIIGVLATMMTLTVSDSTPRAQAAKILANYKIIGTAVASYVADSALSGDDPSANHFNDISADYLTTAKLGEYAVTSADGGRGKFYWYVTYEGDLKDKSNVKKALETVSEDNEWVGFKARIF